MREQAFAAGDAYNGGFFSPKKFIENEVFLALMPSISILRVALTCGFISAEDRCTRLTREKHLKIDEVYFEPCM